MRRAFLLPVALLLTSCSVEDAPREYPRGPAGGDPAMAGDGVAGDAVAGDNVAGDSMGGDPVSVCSCDLSPACDDDGGFNCFCDADCPSTGELTLAPASLDGLVSVSCEGSPCQVDLGDVPLFASKAVTFRMHTLGPAVVISGTQVTSATGTWAVSPGAGAYPVVLGAAIHEVTVTFNPLTEGAASVEVEVLGNAAGGPYLMVVDAAGVFTGAPDIEVQYNSYTGPAPSDCSDTNGDTVPDTCVIPANDALDFGNIGPGGSGVAQLVLRNGSECTPFAGVDPCTLCQLTLAADPEGQNIGLGFKAGSDPAGAFSFVGSVATPFSIRQRKLSPPCDASGEVRILLSFNAPLTAGDYQTVIVVESNDPDEPLIEIPVRAASRNGPTAIAKFRELDPLNPSAPYTDPNDIEPLERVYFDGRDSFDSNDPGDPTLITAYQWQVIEYPSGLDINDFQMQGETTGLFSFWLPLAGHYVVQLSVRNAEGIESGDTPNSRVEFDVIPGSRFHVQLTWDDPENDQDLHLLYLPQTGVACTEPWDCYFSNKTPQWFSGSAVGEGGNPRLDIDDTHGLGPENINIDVPEPFTYRIQVHYWADYTDHSATRNTVRIFVNGLQVAEYRRSLAEETLWSVADVTWQVDGTAHVTQVPSDAPGEVGSVEVFLRDECGGL